MRRFDKHIFVCENVRPQGHPRGCCSEKGSLELRQLFKEKLNRLGINSEVRANSAGCLDACEFGISIVIYPDQVWYGNVKPDDVEDIIQEHIINNKPVERLMIKDKRFNKDM
ncbi:MAG: (2Fe-2S) ferredoxin domain-containing protein [Ignavibacteria bacterium]|jgi:(2Fe-2S) ferredoxin